MEVALDEQAKEFQWISKALRSKNVSVNQVFLQGSTAKGEGYSGDVNFVTVNANNNGNPLTYNLVIKSSTQNEAFRKTMPVRKAYEKEIYFYRSLVPELRKFELEKNLKPFDAVPKFFDGFLLENQEVIVFENLRSHGYDMHDAQEPMNFDHRKLTLEAYAHWHALNFALRDQNPLLFAKLCATTTSSVFTDLAKSADSFVKALQGCNHLVFELLEQRGEYAVLEKYRKKFDNDFKEWFSQILTESENDNCSVYIHGDCWSNNFMFKYQEDDKLKSNPSKVALLDFQLSGIHSPAVDLSYHLYCTTPHNEIENIKEQLTFYHKCLIKKMTELGSDPEKIFPLSKLVEQWKKYSLVGLVMSLCVLPQSLLDEENKPVVEDFTYETMARSQVEKLQPDARKKLFDRLVSNVKHNVNFDD